MSFGAVAAIGGALITSSAASDAADSQADSAAAANATQKEMFDKQIELQAPFREAGLTANNRLMYLLGLGPQDASGAVDSIYQEMLRKAESDHRSAYGVGWEGGAPADVQRDKEKIRALAQQRAQQSTSGGPNEYGSLMRKFGVSDFEADPGYQFRMDEGMKGVERSAAARGGLFSGAAGKQLQRFGQGLASQEYGNAYNRYNADQTNQYNRLAGVVNTGQGASNQVGNAAANYGNQVSANQIGVGNAQAAAGIAQGQAITGGINDAFNYYNQSNALNKALQKPQMDWYS